MFSNKKDDMNKLEASVLAHVATASMDLDEKKDENVKGSNNDEKEKNVPGESSGGNKYKEAEGFDYIPLADDEMGCYFTTWFLNLSKIDSVAQTFAARIHIKLFRQLCDVELSEYLEIKEYNKTNKKKREFKPKLDIKFDLQIAVGSTEYTKIAESVTFNAHYKRHFLCQKFLITTAFSEEFELYNFPFDCQHLQFLCQIKYQIKQLNEYNDMKKKLKMIENFGFIGFVPEGQSFNAVGWELKGFEIGYPCPNDNEKNISIRIIVQRLWKFYIIRVVVVLMIISFMTLFALIFDDGEGINDRLGYISTMLLTAVAYMFITNGFIPPLQYLTLLDKYVFFTFVFILFVAIQVCVLNVLGSDVDDIKFIDYLVLSFDFLIYLIVHILFFMASVKLFGEETNKLNQIKEDIDGDISYKDLYRFDMRKDNAKPLAIASAKQNGQEFEYQVYKKLL